MKRLRVALGMNAGFSAATGSLMAAQPELVAGWVGAGAPEVYLAIGLQLLAFAALVGAVAASRRVRPLVVLAISGADFLWVLGSIALVAGWSSAISGLGIALVLGVAAAVDGFALAQLSGLVRAYRMPRPDGAHTHRVCVEVEADAPHAEMWKVVSDLGAIASYSEGLRSSALVRGDAPGEGAVRRCENTKSQAWSETCTAWEPGRSFTLRFDATAPDFPFPFAAMRGGWTLEPHAGRTRVRVWWELGTRSRMGTLLIPLMAASVTRDMASLVSVMAAAARGEPNRGRDGLGRPLRALAC